MRLQDRRQGSHSHGRGGGQTSERHINTGPCSIVCTSGERRHRNSDSIRVFALAFVFPAAPLHQCGHSAAGREHDGPYRRLLPPREKHRRHGYLQTQQGYGSCCF